MRPEDERWRRPFELVAHREARRRRLGWVPEWLDLQIGEEIMKARLADAQARIRELQAEVECLTGRLQTRTQCALAAQAQCRQCEAEHAAEVERLRRPAAAEQPAPQDVAAHLRRHAETYAVTAGTQGHPTPPEGYPEGTGWWQEALRRTQVREEALARVRAQFLVGALRYGMPEPGRAHEWDWTQRIADELAVYQVTGHPSCLTEILACALGEYADRGFHLSRWESRGDDALKTRAKANGDRCEQATVLIADDLVSGRGLPASHIQEIHDRFMGRFLGRRVGEKTTGQIKSDLTWMLLPSLAAPVIVEGKGIRLVLNGEEIGRVGNLRFDDAGKGSGELRPTSASFSAAIKELHVTGDNFCGPILAPAPTDLQVDFRCPGCGARDATVSETKRMRCPRCGKPMQREGRPNQRRGRRK